MSTETKTLWRLVDERGDGGFLYIDRGDGFDFLQIEDESHGRLIAAAPKMLAALKALNAAFLGIPINAPNSRMPAIIAASDMARAATDQAEGR